MDITQYKRVEYLEAEQVKHEGRAKIEQTNEFTEFIRLIIGTGIIGGF